jgi:hypothetical protein
MPQLSLRYRHRNAQLRKQRTVKVPQSVPAEARNADTIACWIDQSFQEIPVI